MSALRQALDPPAYVGPRHRWRVALLADELSRLMASAQGPVLDLGCGGGSLAALLASCGYDLLACDLDARRLSLLHRQKRASELAGTVRLFRADAQALPVATASLAAVVCGEVLEHVADDALALREIHRVLRPGGVLLLSVPAGSSRMGDIDRAMGHRRRYDRAALAARIGGAGLEIELLRPWGFPFGRVYDRLVQAPALREQDPGVRRRLARLGKNPWLDALWRGLFALDERLSGAAGGWVGERASGWLVVARRPALGPASRLPSSSPPS